MFTEQRFNHFPVDSIQHG